jgi:ferredoxin
MTYVVTEACRDCKYTHCAAVCPAEAFHEAANILYIDPDSCIDCGACVPECPVEAIFPEYELEFNLHHLILQNKIESKKYPVIVNNIRPLKLETCVKK